MAKKNAGCFMASLLVMLVLPRCAVTFVEGDGGMAVCFLLFFAVNPLLSIGVGIVSGRSLKASWFQPLLTALLFWLGAWLFFDGGEPVFLLYAAGYLALGYAAAVLSHFAVKSKKGN